MNTTNTLKAIINIIDNPTYQLMQKYKGRNRINNIGDALERFIQDSFAATLTEIDESLKLEKLESVFSYLGNQNNPRTLQSNIADIAAIASRFAAQGPDALRYWLRHTGRSSYFVGNALLGNLGYMPN